MKALASPNVALIAKDTAAEIAKDPSSASSVGVNISIGSSKSQYSSEQSGSTVKGSTVTAGGSVSISAEGAGQDSDLTVRGSQIQAGDETKLKADGDVLLQAAANTAEQHSTQSSSSASVGVGINFGSSGTGLTVNASVSQARGNADGSDMVWTNTQVQGGKVSIESGGDTTLKGAVVKGDQVTAKVEGNLNIESLQDTSTFDSRHQSAGASVSVAVIGAGGSASANFSKTKVEGDFASVTEQSGIKAGDGGFQVEVKGNTDLKGGSITSNQAAVDQSKNSLTTGTLTTSDIHNKDEYEATSVSVSGGYGSNPSTNKSGINGVGAGIGHQSGKETSTTQSGVSGGALVITDEKQQQALTGKSADETVASVNRDVTSEKDGNAAISKQWDGDELKKDVQAGAQITAVFGQRAAKEIGDYADAKMKELRALGDLEEAKKWEEGGVYRVALHTAAGALGGGLQGAAGALTSATAMANIGKAIDGMDAPEVVKQALGQVTASALGGLVGGAAGAASGLNVEANNRQLHPDETQWLKSQAKKFAQQEGISEQEALSRLTQQALWQVDLVWRSALSDGDDSAAQRFLSGGTGQTFVNDLGQAQALFTATGQQLVRPEMFAETADPAFYRQFAQSGISRELNTGLLKELRDSGVNIASDAAAVAKTVKDHPRAVLDAAGKVGKGLPQTVVDGFVETGRAIGEGSAVALDADLAAKLNAIYGDDVQGLQRAMLAVRIATAVGGAASTAKVGGQLSDAAAEATAAVGKKLDELLDGKARKALMDSGGVHANGQPLLDMSQLTTDQKRQMGELFGEDTVRKIVPNGEKLGRVQGAGTNGIDDLYKVDRPDVDYVVIEYKFDKSTLGNTTDGKQMSDSWLRGDTSRNNRILDSVGGDEQSADQIRLALDSGRVEKWIVRTRPDGSTEVQVLDAAGKPKSVDTSKFFPHR